MHLRRGRDRHFERQENVPQQTHEHHTKSVEAVRAEPAFNWDRLSFPKEVRDLAAARKVLHKKIHEIENRLRFGYSEALHCYKMELVQEDLGLCCQMTGQLVMLKKK